MKIFRAILVASCGFATLALAACGEGYEPVKVQGQVPYTDERTAGPGIAYVRAHMLPEKSVVLPPEPAPSVKAAPPVHDAAPIFDKKMQKK